jgi:hypothetical protein
MAELLKPIQADQYEGQPVNPNSIIIATGQVKLRMKLMKLFSATDFVKVINIDDQPFRWQYMPAQNEEITFDVSSSTVPMKNVHREPPEVYEIAPQQTAIIVGASAYLMIEGLIKQCLASRATRERPNIGPGQARQFGFDDDIKQDEYVKQIYLGKQFPGQEEAPEPTHNVEEDLGLAAPGAPETTTDRKFPPRKQPA